MHSRHSLRFLFALLSFWLIAAFAACGTQPSAGAGTTATGSQSQAPAATPTSQTSQPSPTAAMPHTETSCPAAGTARAAVTAPLPLGKNQNIVYAYNTPNAGILKRYDVVTGTKTDIVNLPNTHIINAQISTDGQFILFTSIPASGTAALQLIRLDGQGLQTLYCVAAPRIGIAGPSNVLWSPNQQLVIFSVPNPISGGIAQLVQVLDLSNGKLQTEINTATQITTGPMNNYVLYAWRNNTQVYMADNVVSPDGGQGNNPPFTGYILDLSKGPDQRLSIQPINKLAGFCWDLGGIPDGSRLFISQCEHNPPGTAGSSITHGPGSVSVQPQPAADIDAARSTIYTNPNAGITTVRPISNSTLLIIIHYGDGAIDKDEIWKINTDGSGLTRLTPQDEKQQYSLNVYTQTTWANVSRDGSMYAMQGRQNGSDTIKLGYASLNGGAPTWFAATTQGSGDVTIAGWTTM